MSFTMNKKFSENHSRSDSQIDDRRSASSSIPLSNSFERRTLAKIYQQIPTTIQTLASLCQLLDDYPLSEMKLEQVEQGTVDSILWNEGHSCPIAIDQNNHLVKFRQSIREYIHEFLEFAQQILIFSNENNEIQKSVNYLSMLNDYRIKRQSAYNYFSDHYKVDGSMLILNNIDRQQYHELRLIALNLRQFFLKLITFISPKFSTLE
ncbi:unnamed protein product [Rotaria socialis]|uniref:Uncharacterized protein n=2 Tax=Rotaria socialis TaxID=392032 RepID=A0A821IRF2_9BILA|nr:unnamed protein product [Rotaria socialis]CAF4702656.1 unnamed protein product [Rotaria socialis]